MPRAKDMFRKVLTVIILLIFLTITYSYIASLVVKKADSVLGIEEFKITEVIFEKGYKEENAEALPKLTVDYKTNRPSNSYIVIDGKNTEVVEGQNFQKEIIYDKSMYGKETTIEIYAADYEKNIVSFKKTILLQKELNMKITITE